MNTPIAERNLDLNHLKSAVSDYVEHNGLTYQKRNLWISELLLSNKKSMMFETNLGYPVVLIDAKLKDNKRELLLIQELSSGIFTPFHNTKLFDSKEIKEGFSWEAIEYIKKISVWRFCWF